jgi:endonuclease/exonuclease/phosphatase family metal-dependent hydrolase
MRTLVTLTLLAAVAVPSAAASAAAEEDGQPHRRSADRPAVKVMTQNLYLGADITRPLEAAQDADGFEGKIVAVGNENDAVYDTVQQTDFRRTRSKLLAQQIAEVKPDLVGLQEVALFRTGPLEIGLDKLLVRNATEVDADYLKILLRRLRQAGVPYRAVHVQDQADIEAPAFEGDPYAEPSTMTDGRDIRVTDRDVVLRRVGSKVEVLKSGGGHFETGLPVDLGGGITVTIPRGYNWVNASVDGRRFRFVNTHLEAFSSDIALGQAEELYAEGGPLDVKGNVLFLGDINSDPLRDDVDANSNVVHSAAYDALVEPRPDGPGLFDEWLRWRPADRGWTSGLSETVDDPTADGFDHRIDMIFGRNGKGRALEPVGGRTLGTKLEDRDLESGLWPSDHGGVFLKLTRLTR